MVESKGDPGLAARIEESLRKEAEAYERIGRFLVEFERACDGLRFGLRCVLQDDGLSTPALADIFLESGFMTANNLLDTYRTVMKQIKVGEKSNEAKAVLQDIHEDFDNLISVRNRIVHGTWFIGGDYFDPETFSVSGVKGKPSPRAGMDIVTLPTMDELSVQIKKAQHVTKLAYQMMKYSCKYSPLAYVLASAEAKDTQ